MSRPGTRSGDPMSAGTTASTTTSRTSDWPIAPEATHATTQAAETTTNDDHPLAGVCGSIIGYRWFGLGTGWRRHTRAQAAMTPPIRHAVTASTTPAAVAPTHTDV